MLWVIRDDIGLAGTKYGSDLAQCGACTVMVEGVAVRSCVTSVEGVEGRKVRTIESIESDGTWQARSRRMGEAHSSSVRVGPEA